jgi:hypothetical protein
MRGSSSDLVGRAAELACLEAALDDPRQDAPGSSSTLGVSSRVDVARAVEEAGARVSA